MRMLGRRPVTDPAALATVVAECLGHLEAGLVLLARPAPAGEVMVDVAGVDARGRLVLILCDLVAGPETVLRAVEGGAWWGEHADLAAHVFAGAGIVPGATPRTFVVATRFTDRALRVLRALGPVAPAAVECRVFEDPGTGPLVSLDRVDVGARRDDARSAARSEPAPARVAAAPATSEDEDAQRAVVLIERLERLRFSEVFR